MDQFGDIYSQYYDLLYSDKDYDAEVDYIDTLIRKNINEGTFDEFHNKYIDKL